MAEWSITEARERSLAESHRLREEARAEEKRRKVVPGIPEWLDLDRLAATVPEDGWRERGACRGTDLNWFPERGQSTKEQKALCENCPSLYPCLSAGLDEEHGIVGGTADRQRRAIRKALRTQSQAA